MDTASHHPMSHIRTYLKQIIYGGNDGIVTTFAIVAGFAGANAEGVAQVGALAVLIFGLANLFADGVSMGLGEFLSSRSAHDLYRQRRHGYIQQMENAPDQAVQQAETLFRAKGLPPEQANRVARDMAAAPKLLAEMVLCHEHGIHPPEEDNPAVNGAMTFVAFVVFGVLPLLPYFLREADALSLWLSAIAMLASLTALGILRWLAIGDQLRKAVLETVGVGTLCAFVAYFVGWLVGG